MRIADRTGASRHARPWLAAALLLAATLPSTVARAQTAPAVPQAPVERPPLPAEVTRCAAAAGRTSALAVHDPESGGWRLTTRGNIKSAADGSWNVECGPRPMAAHTGTAELYRLCAIDAAVVACLIDKAGWRKGRGAATGFLLPPR